MAVRNIASVGGSGNVKPIPIHVWIPPVYNPAYKIEVYDGTNTYDITELVTEAEFIMSKTDSIGEFSLSVDNSIGLYSNLFSAWNKVYLYLDYGETATTKKFTGLIEKCGYKDYTISMSGRSSAVRFIGTAITYSATNTAKSEILKGIIGEYFPDLLTTGIEDNLEIATVNYTETPFLDIIIDLCSDNYDGYVDENFVMQYFLKGSRLNETEAVVHDYNLISVGDFSQDIESVYNKIRVYGEDKGNIPVVYTASDNTSITNYDERFSKIEIKSLKTLAEVQKSAESQLAKSSVASQVGTVLSLLLPTLSPGEKLKISDPENGLEPSEYNVYKITHRFSNDEPPMTEVTIDKDVLNISSLLSDRIKFEVESSNNLNPLGFNYSQVIDFSTESGTYDSTIRESVRDNDNYSYYLTVSDGTTGIWTSDQISLVKIPTRITFKLYGELLDGQISEGVRIQYSFDGGTTYYLWSSEDREISVTDSIILKVTLSSSSTRLQYVGILYD